MGEEPINLTIDGAMKAMLEVVSEPIRRNAEHWSAVHASKGRWGSLPAHLFCLLLTLVHSTHIPSVKISTKPQGDLNLIYCASGWTCPG